MLITYLKYAWRSISKNKAGTTLNIVGLATGIATCLFIIQYIHHEESYDKFHPDVDRLFRVDLGMSNSETGELEYRATNHPATGPFLKKDLAAIEEITRVVDMTLLNGSSILTYDHPRGKRSFYEESMYCVDSAFFDLFGYSLLKGDKSTVLTDQLGVVLTESTAKKYFGDEDPIGKTIRFNEYALFTVSGIMHDPPANSHLRPNALFSASTFSQGLNNTWIWPEFYTYVKLAPNTSLQNLMPAIDDFTDRYLGDIMKQYGITEKMRLTPIDKIHLGGNILKDLEANNSQKTLNILGVFALLILLIAWVNYLNLSTSKSIERKKEIGVKKIIGASKKDIICQFLTEASIINAIALVLALTIFVTLNPYFNELLYDDVSHQINILDIVAERAYLSKIIGILLGGIFLAALYPAIQLSNFRPLGMVKEIKKPGNIQLSLQNGLVLFQFCIGLLMLSATLIVFNQLKYMKNENLGFSTEELLIVKAPTIYDSTVTQKADLFKHQILQHANVRNFTVSSDVPGHLIQNNNSIRRPEQAEEESIFATYLSVDPNYLETYELSLQSGRNFREDQESDLNTVILNEKAIKMLGYNSGDDIIGKSIKLKINLGWEEIQVIGVVNDFKHRSLEFPLEPFVLFNREVVPLDYYTIDMSTTDLAKTIGFIEDKFTQQFPKDPFEYFFLDNYFQSQYNSQQRLAKLIGLFALLAVFVACLGLIGLVTHISLRRAKEAGIRKVLGAKTTDILIIFAKRFILLLIIAAIIATPLAYWGGSTWLQNFAFRSKMSPLVFIAPLACLFLISFGTIIWQSSKVIWIDPAKILRDE